MSKSIVLKLLCLVMLIDNCLNMYKTSPPKNLRNINKIYDSSFTIANDKPVITGNNVFFIGRGDVLQGFNYNKLSLFNSASIFYPYGENSFIKPLNFFSTIIDFRSLFFTKDCSLRAYIDDGKDTCKYLQLQLDFRELKDDYCYDTLRVYYDPLTSFTAVYNIRNKKIIVFDLDETYSKKKRKIILEASMEGNIKKAMIYTRGQKKESVLIGIDGYGTINFWNLKGYKNIFSSFLNHVFHKDLIKSFNTECCLPYSDQDFATFINGDKLLFINGDNFYLYDVNKIKYIRTQYNLIKGVSSLLGLKDGNALVGTESGYMYLISLNNGLIEILDKEKICENKIVFLSSIENCTEGTTYCYTIAVNCGKLKILEIKS